MKKLYKCWTIFLLTTVALSGGAGSWDISFNTWCWTALIQWQQTTAVVVCWAASLLVKPWGLPTPRFFNSTTRISIKSVCNWTFNRRHCIFRETVHLLVVKLEALFCCECCHTAILLASVTREHTSFLLSYYNKTLHEEKITDKIWICIVIINRSHYLHL